MTEFELLVRHSLDRQVPLRSERRPDWTDVLSRAEVTETPTETAKAAFASRRRRVAFALAAAAVAVIALGASPIGSTAADLGRDAFDGLSSWLQGEPGEPAPASEQAGFEARNASSYVSFPQDTKLRLLRRERAGGKSFSLLGFRSGSSLCLRLVRSDRSEARGGNECVTLRELRSSSAPALVASEAHFRFGNPATSVDGLFGFADDTVQTIVLRRLRGGEQAISVSSNVFLALRAQPSGTVARHPPYDPILQVRAVTKAGIRAKVPFIASDFGNYSGGVPTKPSYLSPESPRPSDLPGPKRVEAPFTGGTIGWVERREPRGEAWNPSRLGFGLGGTVLFSRSIQPDPDSPLRIGVSVIRPDRRAFRGRRLDGLLLCSSELRPLAPNESGAGCVRQEGPHFFQARAPLTLSLMGPAQLAVVTGLAADGVAKIEVYLANGRVIPATVRDNVFTVSVPSSQLAKLVAFDERGKVIGMTVLPGSAKPRPCPRAIFTKPASALGAPAAYELVDLGRRTVNGAPIFGRSPAEIEAALGRPDLIRPRLSSNGRGQPTFYYGRRGRNSADLIVQFGWRQGRPRALSLSYSGQRVTDSKLGRILRLQPQELQRRIEAGYGSSYDLEYGYGSVPARGCFAEFASKNRRVKISFGLIPQRPSRPYVVFSHGY
jgi:hypothetical protein